MADSRLGARRECSADMWQHFTRRAKPAAALMSSGPEPDKVDR